MPSIKSWAIPKSIFSQVMPKRFNTNISTMDTTIYIHKWVTKSLEKKKGKKTGRWFLSWDINSYTDCLKIIQGVFCLKFIHEVSIKMKPPAQGYVQRLDTKRKIYTWNYMSSVRCTTKWIYVRELNVNHHLPEPTRAG